MTPILLIDGAGRQHELELERPWLPPVVLVRRLRVMPPLEIGEWRGQTWEVVVFERTNEPSYPPVYRQLVP